MIREWNNHLLPRDVSCTIFLVTGILIFATIIGSLGTMMSSQNQSSRHRVPEGAKPSFDHCFLGQHVREKMDEIKRYMKFRSVDRKLEAKVIKWLDYLYTNRQVLSEEMVLNSDLSVELCKDLAVKVHLESLQQVKLFSDCEPNLLVELVSRISQRSMSPLIINLHCPSLKVTKLKPTFFGPDDYVCRKGDIGKEMYIIKRGQLAVVSDDGKITFVVLKEGAVFGEISILNIPGIAFPLDFEREGRRELEFPRLEERKSSNGQCQIPGLLRSLHTQKR